MIPPLLHRWTRPTLAQLVVRGALDDALRLVDAALVEQPADPALMELRAQVLARLGRREEAELVLVELADQMTGRGFGVRALALLQTAEALMPGAPGIEDRLRTAAVLACLDDVALSPLFEMFTRDELISVVRALDLLDFEPGQILLIQDEPGDSLFVLAMGRVRIYSRSAPGVRPREVDVLDAPQFFGEIALLDGGRRTATVVAATDVKVLVLTPDGLERIVRSQARVRDVIRTFAQERLALVRSR